MMTRGRDAAHENTKVYLAEKIGERCRELLEWCEKRAAEAPPPFYCSVDLRDSGFKIAPVDTNLYPAGFNNICPADVRASRDTAARHLEELGARRVLIIPESNTRNTFYAENLHFLSGILREAGAEVEIGWFDTLATATAPEAPVLESASGKKVPTVAIRREADRLVTARGFDADLILLNNDFSSGYPRALDGLTQAVLPTHKLGWHSRRKSRHFEHYNALAAEFAAILGIDPWTIQIETQTVDDVDFLSEKGTDRVAESVARVLEATRARYREHQVERDPFVFVKSNSGTYGMGIMMVRSADELREMNRRTRNKMSVGKNKLAITSVIVQEGVPTATLVNRLPAEPVIYLMGKDFLGGFLRTNIERGDDENLNAPGMVFKKLCMSDLTPLDEVADPESFAPREPLLELVYGNIARICALAAGREMRDVNE